MRRFSDWKGIDRKPKNTTDMIIFIETVQLIYNVKIFAKTKITVICNIIYLLTLKIAKSRVKLKSINILT